MQRFLNEIEQQLQQIRQLGLYKHERVICSPQDVHIRTRETGEVINFCANNYLGLANHPRLIRAAETALHSHGFGMASVRFICGTQDLHKQLEAAVAAFLRKDDTILYSSCFDANGGLFETLLNEHDAVISDALNHASIIDGIRLCKAARRVYDHGDMNMLEDHLKNTQQHRRRLIATDGVFSMDGDLAKLDEITALARQYDALVMVDDSHATGFVGEHGRGTAEYYHVEDDICLVTSTLGKALGGASGGFTSGPRPVIDLLRQRSRPYLFSNTLTPALAAAAIEALNLIGQADELRRALAENTRYFRQQMGALGFDLKAGVHPIVPVMLYEAELAQQMAGDLLHEGIYVIGFSYPVVPKGQARIRVQLCAAHQRDQLDRAVAAFEKSGRALGVI